MRLSAVAEADRGRGLALAGRRRGDRRDQDQLAVRPVRCERGDEVRPRPWPCRGRRASGPRPGCRAWRRSPRSAAAGARGRSRCRTAGAWRFLPRLRRSGGSGGSACQARHASRRPAAWAVGVEGHVDDDAVLVGPERLQRSEAASASRSGKKCPLRARSRSASTAQSPCRCTKRTRGAAAAEHVAVGALQRRAGQNRDSAPPGLVAVRPASASSQGQRSASSSGMRADIFATLASGESGRPRRTASRARRPALADRGLAAARTPITTICCGSRPMPRRRSGYPRRPSGASRSLPPQIRDRAALCRLKGRNFPRPLSIPGRLEVALHLARPAPCGRGSREETERYRKAGHRRVRQPRRRDAGAGRTGRGPDRRLRHGGWATPHWDDEIEAAMGELFSAPFDLLLGPQDLRHLRRALALRGDGPRRVEFRQAEQRHRGSVQPHHQIRGDALARHARLAEYPGARQGRRGKAARAEGEDGPALLTQGEQRADPGAARQTT